MAAGAIGKAEHDIAIARTMRNLAGAIEDGSAQHLSGVSSKAAVEQLDAALRRCIDLADRSLPYGEQERRKGRPPEPSDIALAKVPRPFVHKSNVQSLCNTLMETARFKTKPAGIVARLEKLAA